MKKVNVFLPVVLLATLALTGCATGLSPVGTGLFTNVKGPLMATGETGNKHGSACARSILGFVNTGDASIETAKKAGDIVTVATVDYESTGFYPFFGKTCTLVTGK